MNIALNFKYPINQSCQVGDIAYYIQTQDIPAGFKVNSNNKYTKIGKIIKIEDIDGNGDGNIDSTKVTIVMGNDVTAPVGSDFIFFAKDRRVNESVIMGYYAKFKFENNSRGKAEMFAVTSEATGNS